MANTKAKKKRDYTPRLRPQSSNNSPAKHGVYALATLLRGDLDGRLAVAKQRNQLEAMWVDHCGGPDRLIPPLIGLIKRIVHKELLASHAEKMALLGEYDLADKRYLALSNSLRLDIVALQQLINHKGNRGRTPTLEEVCAKYEVEDDTDHNTGD